MMEAEERFYNFQRQMGVDIHDTDDNHYQSILQDKAALWSAHEKEWERFEKQLNEFTNRHNRDSDADDCDLPTRTCVCVSNIPFPPVEDGKLILVSLALQLMKNSESDSSSFSDQEDNNNRDERENIQDTYTDSQKKTTTPRLETLARKGFVKAALRWHPDKFQHRILPYIDFTPSNPALPLCTDGEPMTRENVIASFERISKKINTAWEDIK